MPTITIVQLVAGAIPIPIIKLVMRLTGLGLKDSKRIVDSVIGGAAQDIEVSDQDAADRLTGLGVVVQRDGAEVSPPPGVFRSLKECSIASIRPSRVLCTPTHVYIDGACSGAAISPGDVLMIPFIAAMNLSCPILSVREGRLVLEGGEEEAAFWTAMDVLGEELYILPASEE